MLFITFLNFDGMLFKAQRVLRIRTRWMSYGKCLFLQLIPKQPNVLSYDVENRIKPLIEYLISIGIASEDVPGVIAARPNLLGLDVENNLKRMVDYLVYDGKTKEEVLDFVTKTL
ncbi:hypothetical protein CYMTET_26816 [Cymbomonas tetramitiformis]|uniref:Uncharacterized protein n=1 Tax=Cymbomonas tetramitiformis TaxID=36881 RepID=A0AAE0FRB5_9CHLO|nr:hypothetical protein CYMTET_26816 [Cymbomonas tetramitiformis]